MSFVGNEIPLRQPCEGLREIMSDKIRTRVKYDKYDEKELRRLMLKAEVADWKAEELDRAARRVKSALDLPGFREEYDKTRPNIVLPTDSEERKELPLVTGCLDYFPAALAEVARLSKYGNDKHNPGEVLYHAREKSSDHADCLVRHLVERGTLDPSGFSHTVMVAWRALALLQVELEEAGAPLARGARTTEVKFPVLSDSLIDDDEVHPIPSSVKDKGC